MENTQRMKSTIYTLLVIAMLLPEATQAQDEYFIYGKVHTEDGEIYEGPIRWGKEEVYWTDIFNASKERNVNLKMLSDRELEDLRERHYDREWFTWDNRVTHWFSGRSEDRDEKFLHQFAVQFGDIKMIKPVSSEWVEIELQNGEKFELEGEGYNDVGLDIKVTDKEIGEMNLHWNRIEKIEFMNTPGKLQQKFGQPLYGTVEAYGATFTGFIQWDHDERLTTDKLDGDSDDGKMSIEFGKIKSIERRGGRSEVVLYSGRNFIMDGSNDVSSGHRGIIVMNKEFAAVDIPFDEFDKVTFEEKVPNALFGYNDYKTQKLLTGTVTTHDGKTFSGDLVYDLDETYDFELLQGKEGDFEYTIPFRSIKKITPKGSHRCEIELKNGKKIMLDDAQDVDDRNNGMIVRNASKSDSKYIPWDDVASIDFK
jgi:hypothetical protein